jgi:hypothetical protein
MQVIQMLTLPIVNYHADWVIYLPFFINYSYCQLKVSAFIYELQLLAAAPINPRSGQTVVRSLIL